jgi:uncharacterized protein YdhG (YjbR/CyaY superfamily)
MKKVKKSTKRDVDAYIQTFPSDVQRLLRTVRATIRKAAPNAEEVISYGVPTFKLNGNLVHFAGFRKHIGFYPGPDAIVKFKKDIADYKSARGSVQFPLDEPLPVALITKVVKYRVKQALADE